GFGNSGGSFVVASSAGAAARRLNRREKKPLSLIQRPDGTGALSGAERKGNRQAVLHARLLAWKGRLRVVLRATSRENRAVFAASTDRRRRSRACPSRLPA